MVSPQDPTRESRRDLLKKAVIGWGIAATVWVSPQVVGIASAGEATGTDGLAGFIFTGCGDCYTTTGGTAGAGLYFQWPSDTTGPIDVDLSNSAASCDGGGAGTMQNAVQGVDQATAQGLCDAIDSNTYAAVQVAETGACRIWECQPD